MKSIHLPKLRNAEYLQFIKDFAGVISLNDPAGLQIDGKLSALTDETNELEGLFKKAVASDKTKILLALDQRRDDAINGITVFLESHEYHFEDQKRHNAQILLRNLANYGSGIARENYQSETAILNNIFSEWTNDSNLSDAVISLGLTSWLNELNDANTEFNTEYLLRTQEYGDANPQTIKSKREKTKVAYYALRDRIDALHAFSETVESPYTKVINELNALIDQYNTMLMNRKNLSTEEKADKSS
ncbi:DUF6261 family protein [Chryseobacterium caseinilyticum]|uniref:Hemagglutinin n=1 Tax=Chryseobacterium caseinilyticum TaxID=2771428 RepID=A0ABR8ZC82_9FLAO|nr:DUF6261 family protein [Chryseobacterium caseinilyticum]MBD8082924.1 hypothetical protein [Chryseobacterium caseinilyticum]